MQFKIDKLVVGLTQRDDLAPFNFFDTKQLGYLESMNGMNALSAAETNVECPIQYTCNEVHDALQMPQTVTS